VSGLPTELDVLKDVAGRLDAAANPYMLTGSLAMSWYATPRMTRDIDLVVELKPADARRLPALMGEDYYVPDDADRAVESPGMFNVLHVPSMTKIDFVARKDSPYRRTEFDRRHNVDFGHAGISIVAVEDLILSKLLWSKESKSAQQHADVANLLATPLDRSYLDDWADRLGVLSLLHEIERHDR